MCRDQDVFIVGGANSAGQAALLFSRYARSVTLLVRGPSIEASMSHYLVTRIEEAANVSVLPHTQLTEAIGKSRLEAVCLAGPDGTSRAVPASALFIFIGAAPRSDALAGIVERDPQGFILTGPDLLSGGRRPEGWALARDPFLLETSVPGIFAAGDVRHNSTKRVASAVGEGSAAIGMIHRYLETV